MSQVKIAPSILESEAEFFDREAEEEFHRGEIVIPLPEDIRRYKNATIKSTNIPKDTLFALMNPLHGKRVLDYGCGTGENAVLLAACGADVTAFDISPGSIRLAKQRAELHNVADKIQFDVLGAGETPYERESFDIITGFAILHHLHMDLETIYREIGCLLKPGGKAYFIEPVANSALLRALRKITPVPRDATPDERQLEYHEFELMKKFGFSKVEYVHFHCWRRLRRLTGDGIAIYLAKMDHWMQRILPFTKRFYGTVVVIATK